MEQKDDRDARVESIALPAVLKQGGEEEERKAQPQPSLKDASVSGKTPLGSGPAGGDDTGFPGRRRGHSLFHRGWPWLETWLLVPCLQAHVQPLVPGGLLREQGRTEPVLQRARQEGRGAGSSARVVTEVAEESVSGLALCDRRRLKSLIKPDVWQKHW